MSLSIIIIILLLAGFAAGHRQGLVKMLLRIVTFAAAWICARLAARPLGALIAGVLPSIGHSGGYLTNPAHLTDTTSFFYNGIAFTIAFAIVSTLGWWFIRRMGWVRRVPVLGTINAIAGGVVTLVLVYLLIGWCLMILQYWPGRWIQLQMAQSGLARAIINETPYLSQTIISWIG